MSTSTAEETELVQLLTPEGRRVEHPDYAFTGDAAQVAAQLRDMVLSRRIDTEATALQRQGELGLWASLLGQEAAQVGAARALGPNDVVFPTYREHAMAWCMGVDPLALLRLFRGVDLGSWDVEATRFRGYTLVIGAQTLHATGYAMGLERDGMVGNGSPEADAAVLACFGDGATSQGDVNEAFVFASSYHAPVVFLCQNNQWAISEPQSVQSRIPLYRRAQGFGFPGVRVDGNDVLAMQTVTAAALDRARNGGGPTLIEAFTYRMGAHTTSDDPTRYRLEEELEGWRRRDPIERVRSWLQTSGAVGERFFTDLASESDDLAADLRRRCLELVPPPLGDLFDQVHAEPTEYLRAQQQAYREYADSFDTGSLDADPVTSGGAGR